MQALTLFNQNFAVAESLIQLYELFHGMRQVDLKEDLRFAICSFWGSPQHAVMKPSMNDRVLVVAKAAARVPESLTLAGGLNFLLREAVVVACTALESFFSDVLRENVLTVVQARKTRADESLRKLMFTLGDYISIQQYDDQDLRLKQIILKNFERAILYDANSIEKIAGILTIKNFWNEIERITGNKSADFKRALNELIQRRNQIAHRADRPEEDEEADPFGLRPITLAWSNHRIQTTKTIVTASAELIQMTIQRLEEDIQSAKEQEVAQKLIKQMKSEVTG